MSLIVDFGLVFVILGRMIDYDMHIHTEYCGHAKPMNIKAILARADELGLKTIAIATHVFKPLDLNVMEWIREDAAKIEHNCRVIVGAEIDVDGRFCDGRLVTDDLDGIDYVVAGFHYIPGVGNYPRQWSDCSLEPQSMFERWRSSLLGIVSNPRIDTLAHPGRVLACAMDIEPIFNHVLQVFAEAAEISAHNNITWEINEHNGHKINPYCYNNWHRIYQTALDAGVKLIYGSDAHSPEEIGLTSFTSTILDKLPANSLIGPESL
ncbi:PHP domain-containing protein [Planctomycetota bacterium]